MSPSRLLIALGLALVIIGLSWPWLTRLPLFSLPGDFRFGNEKFRVVIPLTSMILLSLVLTLILNLLARWLR